MKIPSKLKIGNIWYSVLSLEKDDMTHYGVSNGRGQWIKLSDDMSQERKEETLIHEIVHQVLDSGEYVKESGNERMVNYLSEKLYSVLKDNDMLK